ncbi:Tomoregulin-1 [Dissostichus eleginoides]|uniref:Tomoregulin-1 n=1 Tax=Dissostichus eleginoides TaxID=100907 RepID=A0AAD9B6B9_DISEL|nr:Tomoregulin-1 [Dissostichus eleginoides]
MRPGKASDAQCNKKYIPVCGSNGDTYQNECFLRRASCKKQRNISILSEGQCYHGMHPIIMNILPLYRVVQPVSR